MLLLLISVAKLLSVREELFIRVSVRVFRDHLSICACASTLLVWKIGSWV